MTSVAVADDIITRFSPGALARLHGSLADMSPDEIHEVWMKHAASEHGSSLTCARNDVRAKVEGSVSNTTW